MAAGDVTRLKTGAIAATSTVPAGDLNWLHTLRCMAFHPSWCRYVLRSFLRRQSHLRRSFRGRNNGSNWDKRAHSKYDRLSQPRPNQASDVAISLPDG